jgi:hypothetical protein
MGTYNLSPSEIKESFKNWIIDQEGEIHAWCLAEVWNNLAKENGWTDRLKAIEKK